jgi:hypothetical protein
VSHELCFLSDTCGSIFFSLSLLPHMLSDSIRDSLSFLPWTLSLSHKVTPVHLHISYVKSSNNSPSLSISRPWRHNFAPPIAWHHGVGAAPRWCGRGSSTARRHGSSMARLLDGGAAPQRGCGSSMARLHHSRAPPRWGTTAWHYHGGFRSELKCFLLLKINFCY